MIGQTIAHYRITGQLGEGGMGVVYRAHDTHLNRPAAIKVLRPEAMRDPERRRRFVQEAQSASALNHPNIITIYDIDRHDGVDYMAMEFVAGQTLDRLLLGGSGLSAAETLKYAIQIADALGRAHAAGIVHRDLKPQNLMVTEDGLVKVLDFGLAKLTEPAGSDDRTATIEVGHTEEGTIIGTVAYMSPEQAEGKKVDVRSDIFSFGCVLYEMITGRQAFTGESRISTLAAILHKEPAPLKELAPDTPVELDRLVARCLRKDLGRRAQHMGDLKILLEELKQDVELGRLGPAPATEPVVSGRRLAPLLAGGLALLILGVAAGWWASRSRAPAPGPQVTRLTSDSGLTTDPALSPDGKLLAFASDRSGEGNLDIWVRQVARSEPVRLTRDPADEYDPAFSPDGTQIAFRSDREGGAIYVMPALGGGEPRLLARGGRNPRFSPDGKWIAYWTGYGTLITAKAFLVPAQGGVPKPLQPDFHIVRHPTWSSDGKRLLFLGAREGEDRPQFDWWIAAGPEEGAGAPLKTGAFDLLSRHGLATGILLVPSDWTGDRVLFSATQGDSTNLWDVSISPRNGQASGAPRRLTFGVGPDSDPSAAAGRVVFSILSQNYDIWGLPIDGNQAKATGPLERLTQDAAPDDHASISADGKRIAFLSTRSGNTDVWVKDLETGKERALTITPQNEGNPVISADGTRVAYGIGPGTTGSVDVVAFEGGVPERACNNCGALLNWFPDGKRLAGAGGPSRHVGLLDLATGRITTLLQHPTYMLFDTYPSPDGRWVAIHLLNSAQTRQVFVAPLREDGPIPQSEWVPVTDGSRPDGFPNWSPDGNLLYLVSDRDGFRCLWAQRLEPATKRPAGAAFPVFHLHEASRSLASTIGLRPLSFAASRNRLVFTLNQRSGSIWMSETSK